MKRKLINLCYITACPAWVKYAEQFIPSLIPQLSTVKSPQQITGILIKTIVAGQLDVKPEQIFSVSVTPCMAMKYEARRDGMMRKGISDVDSVMTVRELAKLIRLNGIDLQIQKRNLPMSHCQGEVHLQLWLKSREEWLKVS